MIFYIYFEFWLKSCSRMDWSGWSRKVSWQRSFAVQFMRSRWRIVAFYWYFLSVFLVWKLDDGIPWICAWTELYRAAETRKKQFKDNPTQNSLNPSENFHEQRQKLRETGRENPSEISCFTTICYTIWILGILGRQWSKKGKWGSSRDVLERNPEIPDKVAGSQE